MSNFLYIIPDLNLKKKMIISIKKFFEVNKKVMNPFHMFRRLLCSNYLLFLNKIHIHYWTFFKALVLMIK